MDEIGQDVDRSFSTVVAAKWFRKLIEKGVPQKKIEDLSNLPCNQLMDVDSRIPLLTFQQLMKCGYELSEDETLALQVGATAQLNEMGILGYMLMHCKDLTEMMEIVVRYGQLLLNMEVQLNEKRDHFALEIFSTRPGLHEIDNSPLIRYRVESAMSWIVSILRSFDKGLSPYELFFKHSRPGYQRFYREVFQSSLHFNQPTNKMLIHKKDLSTRYHSSNPYLLKLYRRHADQLLQQLQRSNSLEGQIERIISAHLDQHVVTLDMVAEQLNMNRWKLIRHLKERKTTFQKIHDSVRLKWAKSYLKDNAVQINSIHELLGYSEPSAFTRAFKRWTGLSPRAFRQKAAF